MCVDPRGTEVGLICSALEAVYRAGRTRLGRSFHEICDALLPLFVGMVRAPPRPEGDSAESGGGEALATGQQVGEVRYDEAPVLHPPGSGQAPGEEGYPHEYAADRGGGPEDYLHSERRKSDYTYGDEDEESAESVEVPSPFPTPGYNLNPGYRGEGGEAADDRSSSSSSDGEGVNLGMSDAYMAEMEQKRNATGGASVAGGAPAAPAPPLRKLSDASDSSSDGEGVGVTMSDAYMAEMEQKRNASASEVGPGAAAAAESAAAAALGAAPTGDAAAGSLVPLSTALGAPRPPTAADIERAMTPYVPPPPGQGQGGASSIRGDLDAAAEQMRRAAAAQQGASSSGGMVATPSGASSGGMVPQQPQQPQYNFSYQPVPASSAAVPARQGQQQQPPPAAAADRIRDDLREGLAHIRRASQTGPAPPSEQRVVPAGPHDPALADPPAPRRSVSRGSLELESEEMVAARAESADGGGQIVPAAVAAEEEGPQALSLRGGGADTDSDSEGGDAEEPMEGGEEEEVEDVGEAEPAVGEMEPAEPPEGEDHGDDDDAVSLAASLAASDAISEDPSNPFSSSAAGHAPAAGGGGVDGGPNALDDSAAMSRGSHSSAHNELQDGRDLDDALTRSVFSESTDNPFSDAGSFAQVRRKRNVEDAFCVCL